MSALTHLLFYLYIFYPRSQVLPFIIFLFSFFFLIARHASVNQERQKGDHPLNICEGTERMTYFLV